MAAGATLVEAAEAGAGPSVGQKRKLVRRDTEQAVSKCLRDNFGNFTEINSDVLLYQGMTLRERLLKDKRSAKMGLATMGANYYRDLRQWYSGEESPMAKLAVKDNNEKVRQELIDALVAMKSNPPNRGPLSEFLSSAVGANQRELVGILKAMLELRPGLSKVHCASSIEIMQFLARSCMTDKFPDEVGLAREAFDVALAQSFVNMKKEGLSIMSWWELYQDIASFVLPIKETKIFWLRRLTGSM